MAEQKHESVLTPVGDAVYPHLVRPDTKFNAAGEYKTRVAFEDNEEIREVIERLEGIRDEFLNSLTPAKRKKVKSVEDVFTEETDDEDEPTGRVIMNFKQKALIKTKKGDEFRPQVHLFDSKNKRVFPKSVGSGSRIACFAEIVPYFMESTKIVGVSLRLKAVQILELREGAATSGDAFGFDVREGGYEGDDTPPADTSPFDGDDAGDESGADY